MALTPSIWRWWRVAGVKVDPEGILLLPAAALAKALLIGNYGTVVCERLRVLLFLVPLGARYSRDGLSGGIARCPVRTATPP